MTPLVNLNGNAYRVEETGYAALVACLEGAARQKRPALARRGALSEGAMIAGVCNGTVAYLNIDPTIVARPRAVGDSPKGVFFFAYVVVAVVILPGQHAGGAGGGAR